MISTHTHIETPFTASTIASIVARHLHLGRKYISYTDMGSISEFARLYKAAKKEKLSVIPGVELFIKDPNAVFDKAAPRSSYFSLSVYAEDQDAFKALSKVLSKSRSMFKNENDDEIPLFDLSDIEFLSQNNVNFVASGPHSPVAKPALMGSNPSYITPTIDWLKSLGRPVFIGLMAGKLDSVWDHQVKLTVYNPKKDQKGSVYLGFKDRVETLITKPGEKAKKIITNAGDLTNGRHFKLLAFVKNGVRFESGVEIISAVEEGRFRPLKKDYIKESNRLHLAIAQKHALPLVATDYAFMADKEDKPVQDVKLVELRRPHAQYVMSDEDFTQDLSDQGIPLSKINEAMAGSSEWAARFDGFSLKHEIRLPGVEGDESSVKKLMGIIKTLNRMPWGNKTYEEQLAKEIKVISKNGVKDFLPYFFPIIDSQKHEMDVGILTGPGRGSAAGGLINYLTGITHVDPIKYGLSFERFLSEDRIKNLDIPDIDSDRGDRDVLVKYLKEKYGKNFAQISTRSMMRLKSSILDVNRYLNGSVEKEVETLSKNLPSAPQGVSDDQFVFGYEDSDGNHHPGLIEYSEDLQKFALDRPKEWEIVRRCLGVTRQSSIHASAFLISDIPIDEFVPKIPNTDITQYEAKGVEGSGGIKYDFLVVKNIKDIQDCLALINKKNKEEKNPTGFFTHNEKNTFIWDLPDDFGVYKSIWGGDTTSLFQVDTASMVPYVMKIKPQSIEDLSTILALVRPGTLDAVDPVSGRNMADEYVERRFGRSSGGIPELNAMIPETYGIIVFQEQVLKIAKELANMVPTEAEKMRRALGKKLKVEVDKFKGTFVEGASARVGKEVAGQIWDQIEKSSRYSFNKSHSTSYGVITYATMFLKHHYPLEWWSSVLSNADKKEIKEKFHKKTKHIVSPPDINTSTDEAVIDYKRGIITSKLTLIKGLSGATVASLVAGRPYLDIQDFANKSPIGPSMSRKLIVVGAMDSLFDKSMSIMDKLQAYEDALEIKSFNDKQLTSKRPPKEPKKGVVDKKYLAMSPIDEFKMKKQILPTMELSVSDLIIDTSKKIKTGTRPVFEAGKKDYTFLDGESAQKIDASEVVNKWGIQYAVAANIVSQKEFSYSGGTKKALKLIVDTDGYSREMVLWPDYDTGKLSYPPIADGDVVILIVKKKGTSQPSITDIVVDF